MKKILKSLILGGFVGFVAFSASAVKAEVLDSVDIHYPATYSVTVGDSENPVYSVDIGTSNLRYDWKFNYTTLKYEWTPTDTCITEQQYANPSAQPFGKYYTSGDCTGEYTETKEDGVTYHSVGVPNIPFISIYDNSENGLVDAAIKFTPSTGYEWTTGKFHNVAYGQSAYNVYKTRASGENLLVDKANILESGQQNYYYVPMTKQSSSYKREATLVVDLDYDGAYQLYPTSGNTIGTITIDFIQLS